MQLRRLQILMWKHLVVRMRRFIHTPIEIFSPLMFILILFCFKDKIRSTGPPSVNSGLQDNGFEIRNTDVLKFRQLPSPRRVFYTPETLITDSLMDAVGGRLGLKRLTSAAPIGASIKGYHAFGNSSEISAWLEKMNSNDAIVMFDDLGDREEFPQHLSYTIRLKGVFVTNEISAMDGTVEPHREFGSAYNQFIRLQWAIDTSFIEIRTGANISQELSLQELPSIRRVHGSDVSLMTVFRTLLPVLCWMSLFMVFVFRMALLLEERSTGIQELVKMVGVSSNMFGVSHFLNALPAGLVYCAAGTALLKCTATPLIPHSDGFLIFIMLALHFVSVVAMAFPCSYVTENTQYTVSLSVFAYVALWLPTRFLSGYNVRGVALLSGLLPHVPIQWLWDEVVARELYGEGLSLSDSFSSHSASGPVALGALCLALQALAMFSLAWYLARVRPGQYGQALPWNFVVQRQYWTKNEVKPEIEMEEDVPIAREPKYFEEPPKDMDVGIKIENVTKVYPKQVALNNVSLDVYKGEITVLLGHNGAGKTTLMSIITGMTSATDGRVLVNGLDAARGDEVRLQLGLCPQHNLFFADLTVLEHAMFFTLLRGGSFKTARKSSHELLEKLRLEEKAHVYSGALSGGMKRRLQLACALAGGADVLVLDEPTSGLDVESRRELWDLLLSLRGERTVLLSTHIMEEADALGDRVAALHLGRLRCYATTMHLKKAIGTGYRLTFTTHGTPRETAVTQAVTSHVANATLKEITINSLSYNLPATASGDFPHLFTALEDRKSELSIETIGVGVSTLEEVFLKLCSDTDHSFSEDEVDNASIEPTFSKVTGPRLYCRQFWVLLKRQFRYVWNKKISFLLLQVIIPIAMICVFTATCNNSNSNRQSDNKITLNLDLYSTLPDRRVLYDVMDDVGLKTISDAWPNVDFLKENNLTEAVLRASAKDPTDYSKYIAGVEISDTHVKALYTTTFRHAAPVSLNLLSNALASRFMDGAGGRTLQAHFDPIPPREHVKLDSEIVEPKGLDLVVTYSLLIVFVVLSTNINAVSLPCSERASGARHLQLMAGCPAALHWAAAAAAHAAAALCLLAAVAAAAALDADRTIHSPAVIMSLMLVLFVGSLAFFSFMYFISFFFQERVANIVLISVLVIFGVITPIIKTASDFYKEATDPSGSSFWEVLLQLASFTMPPHATTVAFAKTVYSARLNALCELNKHKCPVLGIIESGFDAEKCCAGETVQCYMCMDKNAPGKELITLALQFFAYMTLVVLLQLGVFNSLHERLFNPRYRAAAKENESDDEIVRAEAIYVKKQIALPKKQIQESDHALLVSDLHKNYHRVIGKSCNAVKGISFSVKKGECFGLLGVNGAGKSTTFKMLTGEECASRGEVYGNGFYSHERQKYLRTLGYCPQFFGLDDFQTGRENLELLLTLRGLGPADVEREVKSWIQVVGLEKYTERRVCGYSGGCTRRLAAAAALSSGAPLTLLDEPTAGVDVAARRRVWRALRRGLRQQRAVVITSHSMDEMEALCSRIGILAGGRVRALGGAGELRARHAAGYAVTIKVAHARGDEVDGGKPLIEQLKGTVQSKFDCTLKDEHKTMLHYHINETMRYSNLFTALEELKAEFPLIEDYSVTETTLEEVFLSFAKQQRDDEQPARRNHMV